MKNVNLSLIVLLFSNLLMGCGMSGPLYREARVPIDIKNEMAEAEKTNVSSTLDNRSAVIT